MVYFNKISYRLESSYFVLNLNLIHITIEKKTPFPCEREIVAYGSLSVFSHYSPNAKKILSFYLQTHWLHLRKKKKKKKSTKNLFGTF